uniref:Putative secreted protein n=1 Tax=Anopheles marajoara TaxID=58244 RepID=A0A2M4CEU2_9DIPT
MGVELAAAHLAVTRTLCQPADRRQERGSARSLQPKPDRFSTKVSTCSTGRSTFGIPAACQLRQNASSRL